MKKNGPDPKYPFRSMAVGDAFLVPNPPRRFVNYCWRMATLTGRVFRTRLTPEGRRVTRVA